MKFKLVSDFKPTADQQNAIDSLSENHIRGVDHQVLLGVTGSGKTFTIANTIEKLQKPALIISHNKTLAAQLYQEFRDFFPKNAVSYYVSYYDYYQPEAYLPSTDTYIEKDAGINELIDKLRLAATTNLLTRNDVIVIASVSCIYNIGSPKEYKNFVFEFSEGIKMQRKQIIDRLIDLQYERSEYGFNRGTFRVRGNTIDIFPAYQDEAIRLQLGLDNIDKIEIIDPVSGEVYKRNDLYKGTYLLYPSKQYIADPKKNEDVFKLIKKDLDQRVVELKKQGKELEAHRLHQRVLYDLEMIQEIGYVKGIENYSRYFDDRKPGEAPYSLLDYFKEPYGDDWLVFIDESHITFPQIRGMYAGDQSRTKTLVEYGFRLPAALDNRPLKFDEFMRRIPNFIATSATPADWEVNMAQQSSALLKSSPTASLGKFGTNTSKRSVNSPPSQGGAGGGLSGVTEQILRPTGIPDPIIEVRPVETQVKDVIKEIKKRKKKKQRTLVTTLTKKMAEDLAQYLQEQGVDVQYLHSDVKTLERTDILDDLRKGKYDCLVGVNLLREGLDLPEVSLVAILDADKEGFLRSEVSLIQTMGRAARHVEGMVILYADKETGSMQRAISEVDRRRKYQIKMNKKYNIVPQSITKPIREKLIEYQISPDNTFSRKGAGAYEALESIESDSMTPMDRKKLANKLRREMKLAARELNFELAAEIRDKVRELEG